MTGLIRCEARCRREFASSYADQNQRVHQLLLDALRLLLDALRAGRITAEVGVRASSPWGRRLPYATHPPEVRY
jgi:hypothetical protein